MKKFKLMSLFSIIIVSALFFVSCGNNSTNSEDVKEYDVKEKEKYIALAQKAILLFNSGKTEDILGMSTSDLKDAFTDDILNQVYEDISSKGEFVNFTENEFTVVEENNVKLYVVLQKAEYKDKNLVYTISFDENENLAGIYYK